LVEPFLSYKPLVYFIQPNVFSRFILPLFIDFEIKKDEYLFLSAYIVKLPRIQWVPGVLSLGIKRPGHGAIPTFPQYSSWRGA